MFAEIALAFSTVAYLFGSMCSGERNIRFVYIVGSCFSLVAFILTGMISGILGSILFIGIHMFKLSQFRTDLSSGNSNELVVSKDDQFQDQ